MGNTTERGFDGDISRRLNELAVKCWDADALRLLNDPDGIERVNLSFKDEATGRTALHWCCSNTAPGASRIAAALLAAGADLNATDTFGATPLQLAADSGARTIVGLILQRRLCALSAFLDTAGLKDDERKAALVLLQRNGAWNEFGPHSLAPVVRAGQPHLEADAEMDEREDQHVEAAVDAVVCVGDSAAEAALEALVLLLGIDVTPEGVAGAESGGVSDGSTGFVVGVSVANADSGGVDGAPPTKVAAPLSRSALRGIAVAALRWGSPDSAQARMIDCAALALFTAALDRDGSLEGGGEGEGEKAQHYK
tara:strand:+ start:79 stop:1011 length:933 start_codon:yes stop_codon:yes gene_type:complete